MLKVHAGIDNSHLVFYGCVFRGVIMQNDYGRKPVYQAIGQDGAILGESVIYGVALQLILGEQFDHIGKKDECL